MNLNDNFFKIISIFTFILLIAKILKICIDFFL